MWQPPALNIVEVVQSPHFINDVDISPAQLAALKAAYGISFASNTELELYKRATEKSSYKPAERRECVFVIGRRGGKDDKLGANAAIYEATFRTHKLNRGERGFVLLLAATKEQAKVCFGYIRGKLETSPLLARLITDIRADEIDLVNGITIATMPANFRTVRGRSVVCTICSEIAFWHDSETGANPAKEILRALRPSMATFRNSKLILISSPFAKQGVLWDFWEKRHALDWSNHRLVWRMDSLTMNPSLDAERLKEEQVNDPDNYAREYLATFWESASNFLTPEAIQACIIPQRFAWAPQSEFRYTAALDAAFRGDAFAFSVVHIATSGDVVQDVTRSWRGSRAAPVQLAEVLAEIVETLRRYNTTTIYGDQFCSEPIRQALAAKGIEFIQRQTLGARAQCMNSLRTLITSKKIALLDDAETLRELRNLELIVTGSGGARVEARLSHDDRAISLALAAHECISEPPLRAPLFCVIPYFERPAEGEAQRTEQDLRSSIREAHFFSRGRRGLGSLR